MKFLIQIAALAGLLAAGASADAAPRAAEDPSAVVISTNDSAPMVHRSTAQKPKAGKAAPKNKAAGKKAKPASSKSSKSSKKANKQ